MSPAESGEVDSIVLMRTIVRPEPRLVRSHARGEVGERRLGAQLAAQLLARGLELAPLPPDAARPGVAPERVDHRAAHPPLGERLELDAAALVEAAGRVDETDHPVLDQVAELDGMRHRRGDAAGERLDEGQPGGDAIAVTGGKGLTLHGSVPPRAAKRSADGGPLPQRRVPRRKRMKRECRSRRRLWLMRY